MVDYIFSLYFMPSSIFGEKELQNTASFTFEEVPLTSIKNRKALELSDIFTELFKLNF